MDEPLHFDIQSTGHIICGTTADIEARHLEKKVRYSAEGISENARRLYTRRDNPFGEVVVEGISMNYRGALSNLTSRFLKVLGVPKGFINFLVVRMLNDTWKMARAYQYSTLGRRR